MFVGAYFCSSRKNHLSPALFFKLLILMLTNIINNVATLVVVGKWNIHVFNPEWVKKNVFNGEEVLIGISMPLGPLQFKGKSFEMTVSDSRLHFVLLSSDESARIDAVLALRAILRLLGQTPVTAFGINFNFDSDDDLGQLFQKVSPENLSPQPLSATRELKWTLNYPNNNSTNIRLIDRQPGYLFDVNYNYPVNDCMAIMALIDDDSLVATKQEECEQLIMALFNLKADE